MLTKVREKVVRITKAAGVEIILLPDNKYKITIVLLELDKKSIRIEKKQQLENVSPEALKDVLEKDTPVYILLNGRGVLHKKIAESGVESNSLIQHVLPNAKAQDFYIQNIVSEKSSVISIVRKEIADPILEAIEKSHGHCMGFSLGGIVVTTLLPLIQELNNSTSFAWAGHTLEWNVSGTATDYKFQGDPTGKIIQLGSEKIEEQYLMAYAGAFSLLINNDPINPFVDKVIESKEEFLNKELFEKLGWIVLGFFLVVLMVNFILYASYSSTNNELVQKESKYSAMLSEMESLEKEVKEKNSFLSEAGWLNASSTTYFADRIAATVPASVKLMELSINPINERKSKDEKKDSFTTGIILLKGECTRPTELNEWLDKIKAIDKINKAKLVHYNYDNKENKGSFSIEIETQN